MTRPMTRFRPLRLFAALALLAASAPAGAGEPPAGKTLRVLTIGNSFSNDATAFLPKVVESAGHGDVLVLSRAASLGGHSLKQHAGYVRTHAADPDDPKGKPYKTGTPPVNVPLRDILESQAWDVVTIQQVSHQSFKPETYSPFARELVEAVGRHAPTAEVVMHQTWAYRADDPWLEKNGLTDRTMHEKARDAYRAAAAELGLRLIPAGEAFRRGLDDPEWGFEPQAKAGDLRPTAEWPTSEARSLHIGYRWKNRDKKEVAYDPRHASTLRGRYLGALVWYGFLFGRDPETVKFVPPGLPEADAAILRRLARETLAATPPRAPW